MASATKGSVTFRIITIREWRLSWAGFRTT
jgi:hypothetical protein